MPTTIEDRLRATLHAAAAQIDVPPRDLDHDDDGNVVPLRSPRHPRRWTLVAGAAAIVALVGVGSWWVIDGRRPRTLAPATSSGPLGTDLTATPTTTGSSTVPPAPRPSPALDARNDLRAAIAELGRWLGGTSHATVTEIADRGETYDIRRTELSFDGSTRVGVHQWTRTDRVITVDPAKATTDAAPNPSGLGVPSDVIDAVYDRATRTATDRSGAPLTLSDEHRQLIDEALVAVDRLVWVGEQIDPTKHPWLLGPGDPVVALSNDVVRLSRDEVAAIEARHGPTGLISLDTQATVTYHRRATDGMIALARFSDEARSSAKVSTQVDFHRPNDVRLPNLAADRRPVSWNYAPSALVLSATPPDTGGRLLYQGSESHPLWSVVVRAPDGRFGYHSAVLTAGVEHPVGEPNWTVDGTPVLRAEHRYRWQIGEVTVELLSDLAESDIAKLVRATSVGTDGLVGIDASKLGTLRVVYADWSTDEHPTRATRYGAASFGADGAALGGLVFAELRTGAWAEREAMQVLAPPPTPDVQGHPTRWLHDASGALAWELNPGQVAIVGYSGGASSEAMIRHLATIAERAQVLPAAEWANQSTPQLIYRGDGRVSTAAFPAPGCSSLLLLQGRMTAQGAASREGFSVADLTARGDDGVLLPRC